MGDGSSTRRVSPFGHPRFVGYVLLHVAFRSLSRPSSAPGAKASTECSCYLDPLALINPLLRRCQSPSFGHVQSTFPSVEFLPPCIKVFLFASSND